ncbi:hypothetical protein HYH03_008063 [Edaphochlamys debaryana]|uniref:Uncharacterized protein n=1 Tax=Edaphochlamys debaryana TaxID=47281 RepID=A0A835XZF4_9CHLO|nr:hypothetical protein HYH03_008063 [Edaphochlamys debaryana]|eukprot:KAG2493847.1 hypothetical protein HYH03_008063 [Edaphochlamys debaryana]
MAQQAGLSIPATRGSGSSSDASLPPALRAANSLVEAAEAHYAADQKVHALRAHKEAPSATDVVTLRALCKRVGVANANNQEIVLGQKDITARVRALKAREGIPVERAHQAAFAQLLTAIMSSAPELHGLYEDVAWALCTNEPGASWEDRLQPLLAALSTCQAYDAALSQQDAVLERLARERRGAAA